MPLVWDAVVRPSLCFVGLLFRRSLPISLTIGGRIVSAYYSTATCACHMTGNVCIPAPDSCKMNGVKSHISICRPYRKLNLRCALKPCTTYCVVYITSGSEGGIAGLADTLERNDARLDLAEWSRYLKVCEVNH